MKLIDIINKMEDGGELAVFDVDYDIEVYFYNDDSPDEFGKAMNKIASVLNVSEIIKRGGRMKEVSISLNEFKQKAKQYAEGCAFQIEMQTGLNFEWKDNCEVKKAIEDLACAYCTVNDYENRLDKAIDDCWCAMFKD